MKRNAFTLIELSIVLVIIGLIVGGILVGQDLIRAAQLRKVITEVENYQTAINTFRVKYNALPGDMDNAQTFWGVAHADPTTCIGTASTGTETCNGDGNKILGNSTGSHERPRFWQHLGNAELINGTYSGIDGGGGVGLGCFVNGSNCPESSFTGGMYLANYTSSGVTSNYYATPGATHFFLLGSNYGTGFSVNDNPLGALFSSIEAFQIDSKTDDGIPSYGYVQSHARKGAVSGFLVDIRDCATDADPDLAMYDVTSTEDRCAMRFYWKY